MKVRMFLREGSSVLADASNQLPVGSWVVYSTPIFGALNHVRAPSESRMSPDVWFFPEVSSKPHADDILRHSMMRLVEESKSYRGGMEFPDETLFATVSVHGWMNGIICISLMATNHHPEGNAVEVESLDHISALFAPMTRIDRERSADLR